ncbi:hypothetical protein V2J09_008320 [Rumex salicifolius]
MDVASSSGSPGGGSDSIVELNIKTLDSQIYSFHVDKTTSVSSFKEKIAEKIGLPVAQQRLIFRGKVLKDEHLLSEYHVESGHTLHLVERQPAQSQPPSGSSSGDANANHGAQGNDGAPRNRIGRVSHSVVLGSFNVGEQGEGAVPDVNRVIGAVLNSLGIGNQTGANPMPNFATPAVSGQASHGNGTAAEHGSPGNRSQAGNATQPGQSLPSQPVQFPLTGASVPLPSFNAPIPDSLNTLSDFMNQMERVLSQIGNPNDQSSPDMPDQSPTELPFNAAGLPRPEALCFVLRRAEQLLEEGASASVSRIAERLERNLSSTDTSVRTQVQSELVQAGLAMQHLGALFLELGRTILTLRMGQSPAESVINSGPAVYISPQGPNPLMVQPFPLQTSPLFNSSSVSSPPAPAALGHIGVIGSAPRHVNIHIHAGTAFAPMVSAASARPGSAEGTAFAPMVSAASARPGNAEGTQGENNGAGVPANLGSTQILRNVSATVLPHPAGGVTSAVTMEPAVTGVSSSQTEGSSSIASMVAEIDAGLRNLAANPSAGLPEGIMQLFSVVDAGSDTGGAQQTSETNIPRSEPQKVLSESLQGGSSSSNFFQASSSNESKVMPESASRESTEIQDGPNAAKSVPLGLGLLGLQPKKRTQPSNAQLKSAESRTTGATSDESSSTIAAGQQVLQSLASLRSSAGGRNPLNEGDLTRQMPQAPDQGSRSQPDMMGLMSQVLDNPAFSGILSGIAGQTGVGSGDDLRGMFQQLTQSQDARNSINQLAQQVNIQDMSNMFSGSGSRGQDGGGAIDFSSMIQQMMPVVSRALSGNNSSSQTDSFITVERDQQQPEPTSIAQRSEVDIQEVVERINMESPPQDILRAVVEASLVDNEAGNTEELVHELCNDEDLAIEFMEVLSQDLRRRFSDDSK